MMTKKRWFIFMMAVTLILTIITWKPKEITLNLGIFAGSNWDVPSGDSYRVIDNAIERFEKENPHIHIEYESGILKEPPFTGASIQCLHISS